MTKENWWIAAKIFVGLPVLFYVLLSVLEPQKELWTDLTIRSNPKLGYHSVESRFLTHLESIGGGKPDFHLNGWASGPCELKTRE